MQQQLLCGCLWRLRDADCERNSARCVATLVFRAASLCVCLALILTYLFLIGFKGGCDGHINSRIVSVLERVFSSSELSYKEWFFSVDLWHRKDFFGQQKLDLIPSARINYQYLFLQLTFYDLLLTYADAIKYLICFMRVFAVCRVVTAGNIYKTNNGGRNFNFLSIQYSN